MHIKKITSPQPFPIISKIRDLENNLVNVQMVSRMHDSAAVAEQVRLSIALLDIARRYNLLGYSAKAVRTYMRVLYIYDRVIEK